MLGPRLEVGRSLRAPAGLVLPPHRRIAGWSPDGRTIVAPVRGTMTDGAVTRAGGGLVAWFDPALTIEEDLDYLADDDLLVLHAYVVLHAYSNMPGATKAGVAAMKTLVSA